MNEELERGMTREAFLWMDEALGLAAELSEALGPLIPKDPASLPPEMREKWQRVVNALFAAADHADKMPAYLRATVQ